MYVLCRNWISEHKLVDDLTEGMNSLMSIHNIMQGGNWRHINDLEGGGVAV